MIVTCWDDGLMSDIPLLALLEQCQVKATFALTPGRYTSVRRWNSADTQARGVCISPEQLEDYTNHDIWSHSNLHIRRETNPYLDYSNAKAALEQVFQRSVSGLCFPYGDVSLPLLGVARAAGYRYYRAGRLTPPLQDAPRQLLYPNANWLDTPDRIRQIVSEHGYALVVTHTYELKRRADWQRLAVWYRELAGEMTTLTELCQYLEL